MSVKPLTLAESLAETTRVLIVNEIPDAKIEARSLVRAALGISQTELITNSDRPVSAPAGKVLDQFVGRRIQREPLHYITGQVEFFGRDFLVDERVLIPRPESELLIEQALLRISECRIESPRILDIGTGSGILAVTIAAEVPSARVVATDISQDALDMAQENASRNAVSELIEFHNGSITKGLSGEFDIVLCNPPYVLSGFLDDPDVQPELSYEPRTALDGGADGMDVYKRLLVELDGVMASGGAAFIEIDPPVTERCVDLAKRHLPGAELAVLTDLSGLERCMVIEMSCR